MTVLSNIEMILLSLINEKPAYAYEIEKMLVKRDMRRWIKIGVASVYQVLARLEKKKLLISRREKEGKMPERKRYFITDEGKKQLEEAAKKMLSEIEWCYLDLNVGLECSDLLSEEEFQKCLRSRLHKVKVNIEILSQKKLEYRSDQGELTKARAIMKNLILFRKAEQQFLEEFLKELN